ncbi:hypothetical protein BGZ49_007013 [Haplosporangium sp. Z 27]|nr:hypothetical protein BGZ49_007013 [Haplosporangium sp. Z 27]
MSTLTIQHTDADNLYCNVTEDGVSTNSPAPSIKSTKSSSTITTSTSTAPSTKSGVQQSIKSKSTTKSKSSADVDPPGASTKAATSASSFVFSTTVYSSGHYTSTPAQTKKTDGPKSFQSKQLKLVEKKSSATSIKSGKSGKSEKTSIKSPGSSTKSSFFSALTGTFGLNGESTTNLSETKTEATVEKEPETSKEDTKDDTNSKVDNSSRSSVETSEKATEATDDVQVVVEDHSSQENNSHVAETPVIENPSIEISDARRPSFAGSILLRAPTLEPIVPNELLLRRVVSWEYLGRVHHGKMAYYNTILLTEADLRKYYTPELVQKRTYYYFLLGTSIANVLDIPNTSDYAKALSVILHEYDDFLAAETKQKSTFYKGTRKILDHLSIEEDAIEFSHFEVRSLPFEMDYSVVFASLCEVIAESYKKFNTNKVETIITSDVFHKIDVRFKKLLNNTARELEALTREALEEELCSIDPLDMFGVTWDQRSTIA